MRILLLMPLTLVIAVLGGCAGSISGQALPEPRPLGRGVPVGAPSQGNPALAGDVTLRDALAAALQHNPELAAFSCEMRATDARTLQAGLRPNPEIEAESEEVGGGGERAGFDSAVTTLRLSQVIELGGKRAKRKHIAATEAALAGWDYESKRLDVLTSVTRVFVDLLAAQERSTLAAESLSLAERVLAAVAEQVKAGKVSPVEETKAGVAAASARIEQRQAQRGLDAARRQLALLCGASAADFTRAIGRFDQIGPVPSAERLAELVTQNPDVARWQTELDQRQAALALEKSKRVPDVTVSAGAQRFHAEDETAYVVGLSVPLPLFDRNQGAIREAVAKVAKAREEQRAAELRAHVELTAAYEALSSAHAEATALRADVLPAAQSAFDAAQEGFRQGKFDFLVVLDAQRTLIESKGQYIQALAEYHKSIADVERLIGQGLDMVTNYSGDKEDTRHDD